MSTTEAAGEGEPTRTGPSPAFPLSVAEAVARLDKLGYEENGYVDIEAVHGDADDVLLEAVDPLIADAYMRLYKRVGGFWYA